MAAPRPVFACDPDRSRGRLFAEPPSKTRSPFRRDCDRVIHSTAFRRLKHKGPLMERSGAPVGRYREHGIPAGISEYNRTHDLELWSFASLEAQGAAIADDIAYDAHDIDDGLRAGLFTVDDLKIIPLAAEMIADIA